MPEIVDLTGLEPLILRDSPHAKSEADKNLELATKLAAMDGWTSQKILAIVRVEGPPGRWELYVRP